MDQSLSNTSPANGKALPMLLGRGINHRRLDQAQRANLAASVAVGELSFLPSLGQLAVLFNVPVPVLRAHVKARREFTELDEVAENGNGHVYVEDFEYPAVTPVSPHERLAEVVAALGIGGTLNMLAAIEQGAASKI